MLIDTIKKHQAACTWCEGNIIRIGLRDGYLAVTYESGKWFHYDVQKCCWW